MLHSNYGTCSIVQASAPERRSEEYRLSTWPCKDVVRDFLHWKGPKEAGKDGKNSRKTSGSIILLMEEILHQLIGSLSHYLQGFIHPRWCRISAINSIIMKYLISVSISISLEVLVSR